MHAHKLASEARDPAAYLLHALPDGSVPVAAQFVRYTADEAATALDVERRCVQWLMHQLTTYDARTERLVGVRYVSGDVVAHVVRLAGAKTAASSSLVR